MSRRTKETQIFVSKEQAKKLIDESPSDRICVTVIDVENNLSGDTEWMKKFEGCKLIDAAKKVGYENHCMFGRMELTDVLKEEQKFLHYITFAQGSPPTE